MNNSVDRTLLTHAIVVVGVCIGAWIMLVQPQVKGLHAAEAAVAASTEAEQSMTQPLFEKTVQKTAAIKSRISEIQRRNDLMHDSSRLYGQIMDLAASHNVVIQNLQPGAEKVAADAKTSVCRIDLSADGSYQDIADFFDAITNIEGFIRPVSLSIVPTRDNSKQDVIARFTCEAISFKLSDALAQTSTTSGADHAKP